MARRYTRMRKIGSKNDAAGAMERMGSSLPKTPKKGSILGTAQASHAESTRKANDPGPGKLGLGFSSSNYPGKRLGRTGKKQNAEMSPEDSHSPQVAVGGWVQGLDDPVPFSRDFHPSHHVEGHPLHVNVKPDLVADTVPEARLGRHLRSSSMKGYAAHLSKCPGVIQVLDAELAISPTILVEKGRCCDQVLRCVEEMINTHHFDIEDVRIRGCGVGWPTPCPLELPVPWCRGNETENQASYGVETHVESEFVRRWPTNESKASGAREMGDLPVHQHKDTRSETVAESRRFPLGPRTRQLGRFYRQCQSWLSFRNTWNAERKDGVLVYFFRTNTGGLGNKLMVLRYVFFLALILKKELVIMPSDGIDISHYFEEHLYQWKPRNETSVRIHARRCFACDQLDLVKDAKSTANKYTYLNTCSTAKIFASCNLGRHLRQQAPPADMYLQGVLRLWETKHCFLASFFSVKTFIEDLLPAAFVAANHRIALHVRWGDYYLKSVQEGVFPHGNDRRTGFRKLEHCLRRIELDHRSNLSVERNQSTYFFAASDMPKMLHSVIHGMKNFSWTGGSTSKSNIHLLPESKSLHTGRRIRGESMHQSFRPAIFDFVGLSLSDLIYAPGASTFSRQASEFGLTRLTRHC
eukprot:scaffold338_cov361-Pavlova_lutheri.AAC.32